MEPAGISAVLQPLLAGRSTRAGEDAELLTEQLVAFLAHRGLAVDEVHGRQVIVAPVSELTPDACWAFIADHLIAHQSLPVARLTRMARQLARALGEAGERGAIAASRAQELESAAAAATAELPRLDALARSMRALAEHGRPGRDLYARDRRAYAGAMEAWESSRRNEQELEGGFTVEAAYESDLELSHPGGLRLHLVVPQHLAGLARRGDRLDMLLGRAGDRWFVLDAFTAAAPQRG
jgi:hypothetical protein